MAIDIKQIISAAISRIESVSTKARFKIPVTEEEISELLYACYTAEVRSRLAGRNYVIDENAKGYCALVAKWLTSDSLKPCLLMYGGVGNGKSTMLRAIKESIVCLSDSANLMKHTEQPALFDRKEDAARLDGIIKLPPLTIFTAQQLAVNAVDFPSEFSKQKACAFLAIDDLGCEPTVAKSYGTEITPITDVIYYRYDNSLSTIITTNLDRKDIRSRYGDRIADRLNEMFELIAFANGTYRK